jgi:Icc-related predicted phosphoesterase
LNLQVLSDLHFESNRDFIPQVHPECDVLILAGDIGISSRGHVEIGLLKIVEAVAKARLIEPSSAGRILYVPGNHEYDRQDWDLAHLQIQSLCTQHGITFFDHADELISGVRFVGTTLWSDFDLLGSALRSKAMLSAKRYLSATGSTRHGVPMNAEEVRQVGLENRQWLSDRLTLRHPLARKTVVITHFAPSGLSADPRYGLEPSTASFCNDAHDLIPKANLWIHGHLHCPMDYVKSGCRVLSNPLGYAKKGEQVNFKPMSIIQI